MTFSLVHDHAKNTMTMQGVHWGKLTYVTRNEKEKLVVVHVAGHYYWSGRGQQSYAPAQFAVFKYETIDKSDTATAYRVHYPSAVQFDIRTPATAAIPKRGIDLDDGNVVDLRHVKQKGK